MFRGKSRVKYSSDEERVERKKIRRLKGLLLAVEIFFGMLILTAGLLYFVPSFKTGAIKFLTGTSLGRTMVGWFGQSAYQENVQDSDFNSDQIVTNDIDKDKITGTKDILIIGIDARGTDFDDNVNSDTMIVAHVNNDTGDVKMVSIYRDTYMEIFGADGQSLGYRDKANSAYAFEGIQGCINTLNKNMDLNISDYVILNFTGVTRIIDALGGVDVNLTQDEVYQLNYHLTDTKINTGLFAPYIYQSGPTHLVGLQATTYMRIRKTPFYDEETGQEIKNDFGRAARQRLVISKMVSAAKNMGVGTTLEIADMILNSNTNEARIIKTSMTFDEIMGMIPLVFDFKLVGGIGFPANYSDSKYEVQGGDVIVPYPLIGMVKEVHNYLYENDTDYEVSETIKDIAKTLYEETGVDQTDYGSIGNNTTEETETAEENEAYTEGSYSGTENSGYPDSGYNSGAGVDGGYDGNAGYDPNSGYDNGSQGAPMDVPPDNGGY